MKKYNYGIITYNSINIGDEIQSVAASRFLPTIDEYVYRETINSFVPKDNESTTKLIMNAWWMWKPENFPPSRFIDPLLISMHIRPNIREQLLTEEVKKYFVEKGPIGCRDMDTYRWLISKGIKAYFSGCLTLTLQRNYNIPKKNYILCVDVEDSLVEKIKKQTQRPIYSINRMISPYYGSKDRFEIAKIMLRLYHDAALIVSPRLHVILPSLAMETPVLRIISDGIINKSRYEGYENFCNSIDVSNNINDIEQYNFDIPMQNPTKHIELRDKLIEKCFNFTGYDNKESLIKDDIDPLVLFMKLNAYTYPKTRRMCYWISEKDLKITLQDKKKGVTQYDLVGENIVRKKSNYFLKFNYYRCRFILNFIKNEQKRAHYIDKLERLKKTILLNAK